MKKHWMLIGLVVGLFATGCAAPADEHESEGAAEAPSEAATAQPADAPAPNARRHAPRNPRSLLRVWHERTHPRAQSTTEQEENQ